jgi:uncharacterized membrane protein YhhN
MPCLSRADFFLLAVILLVSAVSILCRYRDERLYKIVKPIPLLLIIGLYAFHLAGGHGCSWFALAVLLGLVAGVAGDLLLLSPDKFLAGLAAFLVGHLCYVVAFAAAGFHLPLARLLPVPVATFSFALLLLRSMEPGNRRKYTLPILGYVLAITLLLATALSYDLSGRTRLPLFSLGALLFCISDGILAWNRFARPVHAAQLLILTTYYSAQTLIGFQAICLLA